MPPGQSVCPVHNITILTDRPPEPFHIVLSNARPRPVHADLDAFVQQWLGEARGGELRALIRVGYFTLPVFQ